MAAVELVSSRPEDTAKMLLEHGAKAQNKNNKDLEQFLIERGGKIILKFHFVKAKVPTQNLPRLSSYPSLIGQSEIREYFQFREKTDTIEDVILCGF